MSDPALDLPLFRLYRDAEYHGVELLRRLSCRINDPQLQIDLTRQIADETCHALLWAERICELGGSLARAERVPRRRVQQQPRGSVGELDLFAQLYVAEERLSQQYRTHLARAAQDPQTRSILQTILADEEWHRGWVKRKLTEQSRKFGTTRVAAAVDHFWN